MRAWRSAVAATQTTKSLSPRVGLVGALRQSRSMADLNIENTNINTAPGVQLSDLQKTLVGCVLDLFAGRPSLEKLKLWDDKATFEDPITVAKGRQQYEPQWYGLKTAFSQIERLSHLVTSAGNPIEMDLKQRYVIAGVGAEKTMDSKVEIHIGSDGKIIDVKDKWNGSLPEGAIANAFRSLNAVTVPKLVSVPKDEDKQ